MVMKILTEKECEKCTECDLLKDLEGLEKLYKASNKGSGEYKD